MTDESEELGTTTTISIQPDVELGGEDKIGEDDSVPNIGEIDTAVTTKPSPIYASMKLDATSRMLSIIGIFTIVLSFIFLMFNVPQYSIFLGIFDAILLIIIAIKPKRQLMESQRKGLLYRGDYMMEFPLGIPDSTFKLNIGGRSLNGIRYYDLEDKIHKYLVLCWGSPIEVTTFVKNEKGRNIRKVIRGKLLKIEDEIERVFPSVFVLNEMNNKMEVSVEKREKIKEEIIKRSFISDKVLWFSPFGEENLELYKKGIELLPEIALKRQISDEKAIIMVRNAYEIFGEIVVSTLAQEIPLLEDIIDQYVNPRVVLASLMKKDASNILDLGTLELSGGGSQDVEKALSKILTHKGKLDELLGGEWGIKLIR